MHATWLQGRQARSGDSRIRTVRGAARQSGRALVQPVSIADLRQMAMEMEMESVVPFGLLLLRVIEEFLAAPRTTPRGAGADLTASTPAAPHSPTHGRPRHPTGSEAHRALVTAVPVSVPAAATVAIVAVFTPSGLVSALAAVEVDLIVNDDFTARVNGARRAR